MKSMWNKFLCLLGITNTGPAQVDACLLCNRPHVEWTWKW
jgi:hypothetical protein